VFVVQSRPLGNENWASGGLGAALSQYSSSTKDPGQVFVEPTTTLVKSRSSGGNLLISAQNRTTSFRTERKRAASPMFNSRSQLQERHFGSPTHFSTFLSSTSVLQDPVDVYHADSSKQSAICRPKKAFDPREESGLNSFALSSTVFRSSSKAPFPGMVRMIKIYCKRMIAATSKFISIAFFLCPTI
jgi:hypothetical protein